MSRNYQRTKNNPYLLPRNLYMRVLYVIRDYERRRAEYHAVLRSSPPPPNGMPGSGRLPNPTEEKAVKLAMLFGELEAVEQGYLTIPPEYREGVWRNIMLGARYPIDAGVATYQRWKQRFVYAVAQKLELTADLF